MRPERDRSAVLGEAATVVALTFGFRLAGELAAGALGWVTGPLDGTAGELAATVTSALAASLTWTGVVVAAAYIYLRVTRYRRTTPDPEEQTTRYGTNG
ncbi:hypothetical protein [Halorubellus sp. PRR65]|uniref:hypothetical protein n=1 Tax=Halorubellus sp. PRR65 TaxID=3098148 RepID=UPI002B25D57D|nr:hypothetical protein [Halorubellus sp. PRR65]